MVWLRFRCDRDAQSLTSEPSRRRGAGGRSASRRDHPMPIREIRHPLIRHKIGLMRRADISTKNFRELAQEVGALLTYEATNDLPLEHYEIQGWAGPVQVEKIAGKKITVVPILRAGIGMLDGVLSLVPGA